MESTSTSPSIEAAIEALKDGASFASVRYPISEPQADGFRRIASNPSVIQWTPKAGGIHLNPSTKADHITAAVVEDLVDIAQKDIASLSSYLTPILEDLLENVQFTGEECFSLHAHPTRSEEQYNAKVNQTDARFHFDRASAPDGASFIAIITLHGDACTEFLLPDSLDYCGLFEVLREYDALLQTQRNGYQSATAEDRMLSIYDEIDSFVDTSHVRTCRLGELLFMRLTNRDLNKPGQPLLHRAGQNRKSERLLFKIRELHLDA